MAAVGGGPVIFRALWTDLLLVLAQAGLAAAIFGYTIGQFGRNRSPRRQPAWFKNVPAASPREHHKRVLLNGSVVAALMGLSLGGKAYEPLYALYGLPTGRETQLDMLWPLAGSQAGVVLYAALFVWILTGRRRPAEPPKCPACGYIVYHATGRRCPECGQAFRLEQVDLRLTVVDEQGVLRPVTDEQEARQM